MGGDIPCGDPILLVIRCQSLPQEGHLHFLSQLNLERFAIVLILRSMEDTSVSVCTATTPTPKPQETRDTAPYQATMAQNPASNH